MEAIVVGIYTMILYWLLVMIIPTYMIGPSFISLCIGFFVLGVTKHYLGYLIGLQSLYCNRNNNELALPPSIFDCVAEGVAFVISGVIFHELVVINQKYMAFCIGFSLHIVAEYTGDTCVFYKALL